MTAGINSGRARRKNAFAAQTYAAFFTALAALVIYLSRDLIDLIWGDTQQYVNFAAVRPALYPAFIEVLNGTELGLRLVVYAQSALYLATLFLLIRALHRGWSSPFVTCFFGFAVACNVYLQAFHTVVHTESLSFSCMNLLLLCLLNMTDRQRQDYLKQVALFGLCIGVLIGLRSAMWSLAPAGVAMVVVISLWRGRAFTPASLFATMACLFAPIAAVIMLEAALYHAKHPERESYAPRMMFGKAAMLTTEAGFAMPSLPPAQREVLQRMDEIMQPLENWLRDEEVPLFMRIRMRQSFKNFTTRYALPILAEQGLHPTDAEQKALGLATIAENPLPYLRLSLRYYLDFWLVGSLDYAMAYQSARLPDFGTRALNKIVPSADIARRFHRALFPIFALFGAACFALSVWSWGGVVSAWARKNLREAPATMILTASMLFLAQTNLLFVAFVAQCEVRYLMPVFPLLTLACLLALKFLLERYSGRGACAP